jgi:methanogenic corrinoid protein MtbC1
MFTARPGLDSRASAYLQAVLGRDRASAERLVREMIEGNAPLAEIYAVLGAAQVEIGLLWERGTITVSDEHFATEVTLGCIPMAADRLRKFKRESTGFSFLSTVDGEFHAVGLIMLSELLRSEGWESELHFSGPLLPALKDLAGRRRVDLFCLSATMPSNALRVAEAARDIRRMQAFKTAKILVGGPALVDSKAREAVGTGLVDCLASNLSEALDFSRSLSCRSRQV